MKWDFHEFQKFFSGAFEESFEKVTAFLDPLIEDAVKKHLASRPTSVCLFLLFLFLFVFLTIFCSI